MPTPIPNDFVIYRGNELAFSMLGGETTVASALMVGVEQQWERPETVCDNNGFAVALVGNPVSELTLKFRCFPMIGEPLTRKAVVERICAGLSVKELLKVVEARVMERGKQGVKHVG